MTNQSITQGQVRSQLNAAQLQAARVTKALYSTLAHPEGGFGRASSGDFPLLRLVLPLLAPRELLLRGLEPAAGSAEASPPACCCSAASSGVTPAGMALARVITGWL